MNEADTRGKLIDKQLETAGWKTADDVRVFRKYSINAGKIRIGGVRAGQLKADSVLATKISSLLSSK